MDRMKFPLNEIPIIFTTAIGAPTGITSASLSLAFSLCAGLVKKLLKATRTKKSSIIKLLC